ncbi:titin-like [Anser cygnoides]|uniref:titin-like n=1 Tax=Anser cygnoides TaxID=8845 RepID=UPI0034D27BED
MSSSQHRGAWAVGAGVAAGSSQRWPCHRDVTDVTVTRAYKRGCAMGPATEVRRRWGRMSSQVAAASKEQPARTRRTTLGFPESSAMEHISAMPGVTDQERSSVWDAVSAYIQEHLRLRQGVRVPTLGCFDVVPKRVEDGNKSLTVQWPTFRLARNLVVAHNLTNDKEYLPGHKELEPLKFAEVAAAASVSWKKVEGCIRGTTSLISRCLGKGENIALVLKNMGVLLIEGTTVEIRFYYDFLESLSPKENLQKAVFKVPQLMEMVVSPVSAVASLTFSGRVIVFPDFKMDKAPQLSPRERLKARRDDRQEKERAVSSSPSQGKLPELPPFPGTLSIIFKETAQPWKRRAEQKKKPLFSRLPVIPELPDAENEPSSNQLQEDTAPKREPKTTPKKEPRTPKKEPKKERKTTPKDQAQDRDRAKAVKSAKAQKSKGQKTAKAPPEVRKLSILEALPETERVKRPEPQKAPGPLTTPIISMLSVSNSEGSRVQERSDDRGGFQPGRSSSQRLAKLRAEKFWSVLPDRPKMEASNSKASPPKEPSSPSGFGPLTHRGASSMQLQPPKLVPRRPTPWPSPW